MTELTRYNTDICASCNKIIPDGEGRYCKPPKWLIQCNECELIDRLNEKNRKSHQKLYGTYNQ